MAEGRGVWVYLVARGTGDGGLEGLTGLDVLTGLDGQPVRTVRAAGLAAVVTTVRLAGFGEQALRRQLEDMAWLEAAARAHHLVIDTVAGQQPAVPMRLATVYRDDAGVAAMLAGRRADFAAALGRVRARAEWGVKVFPPPGSGQPAAARARAGETGTGAARPGGPGRARAGAGAAYLSRRRQELSAAERARQAVAASAEDIHATLSRLAAAAAARAPQAPQLTGGQEHMIMNGAYLVDDAQAAVFTTAVRELAARHPGVRVELTGPWPPYSFATLPEAQAAT